MKTKTCLRFPGGKFYGLKAILPYLKIDHKEYRELFVGGGSVFLAKNPATEANWINDIDKDLINFYKVIQDNDTRLQLFELLRNEIASKERHLQIKQLTPKNNVERAFKFFYLNRTSFSGIMVKPRWGYMIGSSVTPDRWTKIIEPVSSKLKNVKITCLDFRKVLKLKSNFDDNDVLIYLDPPYFAASKNIYNKPFTREDHFDLCNILKTCKFKFVLSYDDFDEIRDMYNWAFIEQSNWTYFMSEERRQEGRELIITNFKINKRLDDVYTV